MALCPLSLLASSSLSCEPGISYTRTRKHNAHIVESPQALRAGMRDPELATPLYL